MLKIVHKLENADHVWVFILLNTGLNRLSFSQLSLECQLGVISMSVVYNANMARQRKLNSHLWRLLILVFHWMMSLSLFQSVIINYYVMS